VLQDLGLRLGWNVMLYSNNQMSTEPQLNDDVTITLETLNLYSRYDTITVNGSPRRTEQNYDIGFRPYGWMLVDDLAFQNTSSATFTGFEFDLEENTSFSLSLTGAPPTDHYIPVEKPENDIADFESCCQGEIPRAVELPVAYLMENDADNAFTFVDEPDGGICNDSRYILMIHNPYPTHLWLAQWYLINDEDPGWYVRYGSQEEWWKDFSRDDYGDSLLNIDAVSCNVYPSWVQTSE
jgi:hypothetical protein